jgi:hypothetical protein
VAVSAGKLARTAQPLEKYPRVDDILTVWSLLPSRIEWMILYDGSIDSFNLEHHTGNYFAGPYFEPCDLKVLSVIGYDDGEGRKRYALPRRARRFIYYVSIGSIS